MIYTFLFQQRVVGPLIREYSLREAFGHSPGIMRFPCLFENVTCSTI